MDLPPSAVAVRNPDAKEMAASGQSDAKYNRLRDLLTKLIQGDDDHELQSAWYSPYQARCRMLRDNEIPTFYEVEKEDGTREIKEVTMVCREREHGTAVDDAVYLGRPIRYIRSAVYQETVDCVIKSIKELLANAPAPQP